FVYFGKTHQYADAAQVIALLRKCAERPSRYGAANKSDELAPPHSKPPTLQARHRIRIKLLLEGPIPLWGSLKKSAVASRVGDHASGRERADASGLNTGHHRSAIAPGHANRTVSFCRAGGRVPSSPTSQVR